MLSVIVYGRNDSHGYNPHKRAALSLNCIAQLLDDPDDEIVFVDYNTPDNLPTFIEAIQDTLTDQARQRLRILRVRPTVHDRLRGRTHLQAVESIARNIGARRSNPTNRWLLSSNTDMIFVPHRAGRSLSNIASELEDGFYCLPRFELPENFWELLNRTDPRDTIARTGEWGTRFHLNDIVHGGADILYDAPGDFQLMLRQDLFEIGGFDERMILGWHVDSNISRRLRMLRGAVRGAVDHLYGYHCDHTRQVTLLHGHDRVEDDWKRFVEDVERPDLPEQLDGWGLADEKIEEFTLDRSQGVLYVRALSELLEPMPVRALESTHTDEGFHDLSYSPHHVLPYLCDVLSGMPRHWNLAYLGCRPSLYGLLRMAWTALGFTGTILRPEGFGHLGDGPLLPVTEVYAGATLVLAEFGYGSDDDTAMAASRPGDWSLPDTARLTLTMKTFEDFMRTEAARVVPPGEAPRYFITVNAIYNIFENSVLSNLSVTYTPYSSRVRHGFLLGTRLPAPTLERRAMGRWLQARLGRQAPVPFNELSHLLRLATSLLRDGNVPDDHPASVSALLAVPLLALLDHPDLGDLTGAAPARIAALRAEVDGARPSRALRALLPPQPATPPDGTPSRMAAVEAWEDPDWRRWAHRHFGGANAYNYFDRGVWNWERIQLLATLDRLGALREDKAVLVVTGVPDAFYAVLTQHVGQVDVVNPGAEPEDADEAARWAKPIELLLPDRLRVMHRGFSESVLPTPAYDAVVFVGDRLFGYGDAAVEPLLAWARARLRPEGLLAFSGRVLLVGNRPDHWLTGRRAADGEVGRLLADHADFEPLGNFDATLSDATLDRLDDSAAGWNHHGHFITRAEGCLFTTGLWFARKHGAGPAKRLGGAVSGDLLPAMRPGPGVAAGPDGMALKAETPSGLAMFGPYLRLPAGRYRLILDITVKDTAWPAFQPLLSMAVKVDNTTAPLGWWDLAPADLAGEGIGGRAELTFDVPEELDPLVGRGAAFEIPIHHFGGVALTIHSLRLVRTPADRAPPPALRLRPLARMEATSLAEPHPPGVTVGAETPPTDLLYGPNLRLPGGRYRLRVDAAPNRPAYPGRGAMTVTVLAGATVERRQDVRAGELLDKSAAVLFDVPPNLAMTAADGGQPYEFRIAHPGGLGLTLNDLLLERLSNGDGEAPLPALSLDLQSRMQVPETMAREGTSVTVEAGAEPGLMLFGPHLALRGGIYRLTLAVAVPDGHNPRDALLSLRVTDGEEAPRLWHDLLSGDLAAGSVALNVALPDREAASWEFQVAHYGRARVTILALDLEGPLAGENETTLLPAVTLAPLGRMTRATDTQCDGVTVTSAGNELEAPFLYGPYLRLPAGGYRLLLSASAEDAAADREVLGVEITADGRPILMTDLCAAHLTTGPVAIDFPVSREQAASTGQEGAIFEFRLTRLDGRIIVTDLRLNSRPETGTEDGTTGTAMPPQVNLALLPRLRCPGGPQDGGSVRAPRGKPVEALLFSPYLRLPAGGYRLLLSASAEDAAADREVLGVEVAVDGRPILMTDLCAAHLTAGPVAIDFPVSREQAASAGQEGAIFEFRLTRLDGQIIVTDLRLESGPEDGTAGTALTPRINLALLPRLRSEGGLRNGGNVQAPRGKPVEALLFGPYLRLPVGRYEVTLAGTAKSGLFARSKPVLTAKVVAGESLLAEPVPIASASLVQGLARLVFTITDKQTDDAIEVVVSHTGNGDVTIKGVSLRRLSAPT